MANEEGENLVEDMGVQALNLGKIIKASDLEAMIDSINIVDISSAATKVMKGRGSIASIGKIHNVPYLEDLAA